MSVLAPYLKTEYQWSNTDFALLIIAAAILVIQPFFGASVATAKQPHLWLNPYFLNSLKAVRATLAA